MMAAATLLLSAAASGVAELPLIELPAQLPGGAPLAVIVSGDGGWGGLVKQIGRELAEQGVPVVGLNSLKYFLKRRTPEETARDLETVLRHYLVLWQRDKFVLLGYSLGADVLPFMASRLPDDLLQRLQSLLLLGPATAVDLKFHLSYWLGGRPPATSLAVVPEVLKLAGHRMVCVYGADEKDSACRMLEPGLAQTIALEGAHHFGGDHEGVTKIVLAEAVGLRP